MTSTLKICQVWLKDMVEQKSEVCKCGFYSNLVVAVHVNVFSYFLISPNDLFCVYM